MSQISEEKVKIKMWQRRGKRNKKRIISCERIKKKAIIKSGKDDVKMSQ